MNTSPTLTAPQTRVADAIHRGSHLIRVLSRSAWPVVDLLLRISLAQAFFVSGVLKAASWETALNLARYEYPVPWMDPVTAAYAGVAIELVAPVLLVLGLATRAAAIALLLLTLAVQQYYVAFDSQLFWAWLFAWYVAQGAGPLSLDRLLARGLADSALPLAFHGGGPIGLDLLIGNLLRHRLPGLTEPDLDGLASLPRVVIVGAGFGGIACAGALRHAPVSVTLIDRHNYHPFQPLLYQVATAGLALSDVATPVREVLREQRNARVLLGTVTGMGLLHRTENIVR